VDMVILGRPIPRGTSFPPNALTEGLRAWNFIL
jgi:hypothetical protein